MRSKLPLSIAIIVILVVILLVINFVLPRVNLPGADNQNGEANNEARMAPTVREISLTKDGFTPASLTVKVGEIVVITNNSNEIATVNSNPHPVHNLYRELNLGEFAPGSSVQVMFENPGTYGYHNHFNEDQQGTIVVE